MIPERIRSDCDLHKLFLVHHCPLQVFIEGLGGDYGGGLCVGFVEGVVVGLFRVIAIGKQPDPVAEEGVEGGEFVVALDNGP